MREGIGGYWAAMATPLSASGDVDLAAFVEHAQFLLSEGCDGVVPFGTTGEGTSFSAAERLRAVEALLSSGVAAERIGLGAGFPAVPDAVALIREALGLGVCRTLVLPPYYLRDVAAAGIEAAFSRVIDGVGDDRLRMTLYHIPQVSGVAVSPAVLASLRRSFGVVVAGVKDSSGDYQQFQAFRAAAPEAGVLVGNEADIWRAMQDGGAGTICGMSNVVPGLVRAMFDGPAASGPMQAALSLMTGAFVPVMKSILAAQTGDDAWLRVRAPLLPGDAAEGQRIAQAMAQIGMPAAA